MWFLDLKNNQQTKFKCRISDWPADVLSLLLGTGVDFADPLTVISECVDVSQ